MHITPFIPKIGGSLKWKNAGPPPRFPAISPKFKLKLKKGKSLSTAGVVLVADAFGCCAAA